MEATKPQVFINEEELGIKHRSTLKRMKDKIKKDEYVSLKKKFMKKLVAKFFEKI